MTPDRAQLERDLAAVPFQEGAARGRWRLITIAWPFATFGITAKDGREFAVRLECSGYPAQPPTGGLWDLAGNAILPAVKWPRGDAVFLGTFRQDWHMGAALYFPLDRLSRQGHPDWANTHPHLTWKPEKGIVQHLAEVHRFLNSRGYHGVA
ncbi:hypothetical protein [uncultured Methylobacterium sp.]|uniref:DUF7665 family protein n=1 Tax=uncultured Methylobacterium sp. TaxID=157278 RepID=UPI002592CA89|nr:hypothetical protein [uncultured Methylobacterium sp.]